MLRKSAFIALGAGLAVACVLTLFTLWSGLWSPRSPMLLAAAPHALSIGLQPAVTTTSLNATITVDVVITDAVDLEARSSSLCPMHRPSLPSPMCTWRLLGSSSRPAYALGPHIDSNAGTVSFGGYTLGATPSGPNGAGILATITFHALGIGNSDLVFTHSLITDRLAACSGGDDAARPDHCVWRDASANDTADITQHPTVAATAADANEHPHACAERRANPQHANARLNRPRPGRRSHPQRRRRRPRAHRRRPPARQQPRHAGAIGHALPAHGRAIAHAYGHASAPPKPTKTPHPHRHADDPPPTGRRPPIRHGAESAEHRFPQSDGQSAHVDGSPWWPRPWIATSAWITWPCGYITIDS
ncbi:cohesin domain-containing protein [Candidatus Amarolinea dominans]|uniref:cohesin domain-containing protein n=1 Tax=Candidatus Amarolinea dominans TaxID=3140696 RepID=UPI0031372A8F|nr:hypothetical protein [Anaerolineae bacterium]